MQDHAADQLHIEVAHVQNAAAAFADHSKSFHQKLIENFIDCLDALGVEFFPAVLIGIGLVRNMSQAILYPLAEFIRFGAQLFIAELAHGGFERVNGLDSRHQALDLALVLGSEDLGYKSINQNENPWRGTTPAILEG